MCGPLYESRLQCCCCHFRTRTRSDPEIIDRSRGCPLPPFTLNPRSSPTWPINFESDRTNQQQHSKPTPPHVASVESSGSRDGVDRNRFHLYDSNCLQPQRCRFDLYANKTERVSGKLDDGEILKYRYHLTVGRHKVQNKNSKPKRPNLLNPKLIWKTLLFL